MWFWGRWGFVPNGAYSLLLLAIPGFVWAYRRGSLAAVWLYVLLITWWTVIQPFAWRLDELSPIFIGAVAGLMLIIGGSHPRGSRFAEPYRELGVLLMAGVLMVLSFHSANQEIFGRQYYHFASATRLATRPIPGPAGSWALLAATAIAAVGVLYLASKLQADESSEPIPPHVRMLRTARRQWLPVALTSLMMFLFVWWCLDAGPLIPTILANIAMIVLGFWLIVTGLHQDAGRTFAAGVVYVLLWAVMRYIDMFGDVGGMLGAAGIFLMCGLACLELPGSGATARSCSMSSDASAPTYADMGRLAVAYQRTRLANRARAARPRLGVAFQVVFLVAMMVRPLMTLATGDTILLRVVPVDPRDLFRGDYVITQLRDQSARLKPDQTVGSELGPTDRMTNKEGKTIYVLLEPEADGKHWQSSSYQFEPPSDGKFIRGTVSKVTGSVKFGIEQYLSRKGRGTITRRRSARKSFRLKWLSTRMVPRKSSD